MSVTFIFVSPERSSQTLPSTVEGMIARGEVERLIQFCLKRNWNSTRVQFLRNPVCRSLGNPAPLTALRYELLMQAIEEKDEWMLSKIHLNFRFPDFAGYKHLLAYHSMTKYLEHPTRLSTQRIFLRITRSCPLDDTIKSYLFSALWTTLRVSDIVFENQILNQFDQIQPDWFKERARLTNRFDS